MSCGYDQGVRRTQWLVRYREGVFHNSRIINVQRSDPADAFMSEILYKLSTVCVCVCVISIQYWNPCLDVKTYTRLTPHTCAGTLFGAGFNQACSTFRTLGQANARFSVHLISFISLDLQGRNVKRWQFQGLFNGRPSEVSHRFRFSAFFNTQYYGNAENVFTCPRMILLEGVGRSLPYDAIQWTLFPLSWLWKMPRWACRREWRRTLLLFIWAIWIFILYKMYHVATFMDLGQAGCLKKEQSG